MYLLISTLKRNATLIALMAFSIIQLDAQEISYIQNPSFENKTPQYECPPKGWFDCGDEKQSAVDVHSADSEMFGVKHKPSDGKTFIGMVVRADTTWECIGQKLAVPLKNGKKYAFTIDLCQSPTLKSHTPKSKEKLLFNEDTVLRIQGSNSETGQNEVLAISNAIQNEDWQSYRFELTPNQNYDVILFEAFYHLPQSNGYNNGNILLDNCSRIEEVEP